MSLMNNGDGFDVRESWGQKIMSGMCKNWQMLLADDVVQDLFAMGKTANYMCLLTMG